MIAHLNRELTRTRGALLSNISVNLVFSRGCSENPNRIGLDGVAARTCDEGTRPVVTKDALKCVLQAAGRSHHEFETVYLDGVRDELWPGYYAAFTLGRLPDLDMTPSRLAALLEQAKGDDWAEVAAELVMAALSAA
jgi:hypothetical protein